jgi:hypothetical protein
VPQARRWCGGVLVALALAGCDEEVFVKGIVRDPTGAPLEGATVTFTSPGRPADTAQTPNDGTFNVGMIGANPDKARVSFEKEGFQKVERSLEGRPQWAMDITLTPKANE